MKQKIMIYIATQQIHGVGVGWGGVGGGGGVGQGGVGVNWMKQSHLFTPPLFEIEHCSRLRAEPNSLAYL
jgi:hypothetical protein